MWRLLRDVFSSFHPIVNFIYFVLVIMCSMFFMHPVFLGISLCSAILYSIYLNGLRAIKFNFLFMLPVLLLFAALNPLFNHEGATVLFHIQNNPITAEALIYGLAAAAMFVSVIIWFSCYNVVMTSDKFIFLFGRVIPAYHWYFLWCCDWSPDWRRKFTWFQMHKSVLVRMPQTVICCSE